MSWPQPSRPASTPTGSNGHGAPRRGIAVGLGRAFWLADHYDDDQLRPALTDNQWQWERLRDDRRPPRPVSADRARTARNHRCPARGRACTCLLIRIRLRRATRPFDPAVDPPSARRVAAGPGDYRRYVITDVNRPTRPAPE